jgi:hypothetical protein
MNEISNLAKKLWERSGKPHGRDEEFWYRAENLLKLTQLTCDCCGDKYIGRLIDNIDEWSFCSADCSKHGPAENW